MGCIRLEQEGGRVSDVAASKVGGLFRWQMFVTFLMGTDSITVFGV